MSEAFRQQGIFPKIYVTSVMAGEKSGSLVEVLERFITYQKLALGVRKKVLVSLMYPSVLIVLVILLMVFLVTYVVPSFASLYSSMSAQLPTITLYLIAIGTTARAYVLVYAAALFGLGGLFYWWSRKETAREKIDRVKIKVPLFGDIWIKYQVAQFARVLSTLLTGGIPLMQGLDTAADSLGTPLLRKTLEGAGRMVREGQTLSSSLAATHVFPELAVDMVEVGESTGALPADADQRGGVLRRRREHEDDRGAFADRAGHHDFHGHVRGVCADRALSADLLSGRHDSVSCHDRQPISGALLSAWTAPRKARISATRTFASEVKSSPH